MTTHPPCNGETWTLCSHGFSTIGMDSWPWLDDDDDSEEVFLAEPLMLSEFDAGIATFDSFTLPPPSLLEALDLARARPIAHVARQAAVDDEFLAVCAGLARLTLSVIYLPGKGRSRTGPLTHWPRRSVRNAVVGSRQTRKARTAKGEDGGCREMGTALIASRHHGQRRGGGCRLL